MSGDRLKRVYARALAGSYPVALWAIVLIAFGLRLYHATSHDFTGDEDPNILLADSIRLNLASPHLVFTSAGHPLLIAYLAHFGSLVFGKSLLGYRMPLVLIGSLTCWAVYRLGRELDGKAVGLWAAALIAVDQFHVTASGTVHCHDVPLVFFGTLALLSCYRITPQGSLRPFLSLGLWMGLAYLGKETALMIWPALWLFFLLSKERRAVLRDPRWYLAHILFLAVVAPDITWNLAHVSGGGYLRESAGKALGGALRVHGRALSLFLGEVVMIFEPDALGGLSGYWCWPLRTMHWVAGGLYLFATAWACRFRQRPGVFLLELCFSVTVLAVTLTPGKEVWDPFWWAAMAMIPAVILSGLYINQCVNRDHRSVWVFTPLLVWLLLRTIQTLMEVPFSIEDCVRSGRL